MTRSKNSIKPLLAATVCGAICFVACAVEAIAVPPRKVPVTPAMRAKGVTEAKVTSDGVVQYLINDQWHDSIPATRGSGSASSKPGTIGRTPPGTTAVGAPDAQGLRPVVFNDGRTGTMLSDGTLKTADANGKPIIKRPGKGWTYQQGGAPVPPQGIPTRNTSTTTTSSTTTVAPTIAPPITKTTVAPPTTAAPTTNNAAGADLGSLLQSGPVGGPGVRHRPGGVGSLTGESR